MPGYRLPLCPGDATGVLLTADGSIEGTLVAVRVDRVGEEVRGTARDGSVGRVGCLPVRASGVVLGLDGRGEGESVGRIEGLLADGGARGATGEDGRVSDADSRRGRRARAATPQVRAALAAALRRRRRAAPRRMAR
ncbi:hypothetical protein AS200_13865 [Streptomyces sp. CdTB01]|nr:hypothetical protein AS200_13865 [Streptomyces sp. CdTB01]